MVGGANSEHVREWAGSGAGCSACGRDYGGVTHQVGRKVAEVCGSMGGVLGSAAVSAVVG